MAAAIMQHLNTLTGNFMWKKIKKERKDIFSTDGLFTGINQIKSISILFYVGSHRVDIRQKQNKKA